LHYEIRSVGLSCILSFSLPALGSAICAENAPAGPNSAYRPPRHSVRALPMSSPLFSSDSRFCSLFKEYGGLVLDRHIGYVLHSGWILWIVDPLRYRTSCYSTSEVKIEWWLRMEAHPKHGLEEQAWCDLRAFLSRHDAEVLFAADRSVW